MTFDQDFKEKVKEIAKDYWKDIHWKEDLEKLEKFAKRFYDMGKEG
jgi:hypothetical protein